MTRKIILLQIGIALSTFFTFAQLNITYFDEYWTKTTPEQAAYYRTKPVPVDSGFVITDYYIGGQLQMRGVSLSDTTDSFVGNVTWYYPNGKIKQVAEYKNGYNDGLIVCFDSLGSLTSKGIYVEGNPYSGSFETDYEQYRSIALFTDGVATQYSFSDNYNNNKAHVECFLTDNQTFKSISYYNQYGDLVGNATEIGESFNVINGDEVTYNYNPMVINSVSKIKNGVKSGPVKYYYSDGSLKYIEYIEDYDPSTEVETIIAQVFYNRINQTKDSLIYSEGLPFEGLLYTFQYDGAKSSDYDQVIAIDSYKNGTLNGISQYFDPSGYLKSSVTYVDGDIVGDKITFDANGNIKYKLTYKDGVEWNGTVEENSIITEYVDGSVTLTKELYTNQQVKKVTKNLKDGSTEATYYSISGEILGVLKTDAFYNMSGQEITFDVDSLYSINYYQNGNIIREIRYVKGDLLYDKSNNGTSLFTDPVSKQKYSCIYRDGSPFEGTALTYDYYYDVLSAKETFHNGMLNGESIEYQYDYESSVNNISKISTHQNDVLNGVQVEYYMGKPIMTKNFVDGIQQGESFFYDKDQQLLSKVNYVDGVAQNGKVYEFDNYHDIASSWNYENGALNGESVMYNYNNPVKILLYKNGDVVNQTTYCSFLTDTTLILTYSDGIPFNGKTAEDNTIQEYTNGTLVSTTIYNTENEPFIVSQQTFIDDQQKNTNYYSNGNVKDTYTIIDYYTQGESTAYNVDGDKLAQGMYVDSSPVSGSFAFFNVYDDSSYLILTLKNRCYEVVQYIDGKIYAKLSYVVKGKSDEPLLTIDTFLSSLSSQYPDYTIYKY